MFSFYVHNIYTYCEKEFSLHTSFYTFQNAKLQIKSELQYLLGVNCSKIRQFTAIRIRKRT